MGRLFKLWRQQNGTPIMQEYQNKEHNPIVEKLTFENDRGRNYYVAGDCILPGLKRYDKLAELYPKLKLAEQGETSVLEDLIGIALVFAGIGKKEYKTARLITHLEPQSAGYGFIRSVFVVFIDGAMVTPGKEETWSLDDLEARFIYHRNAACTVPLIEGFLDLTTSVLAGGVSSIAKKGAKKLAGVAVKRLFREGVERLCAAIVKKLIEGLVTGTTAALIAFAKEMRSTIPVLNLVRWGGNVPAATISVAVSAASLKAAHTFVAKILGVVEDAIFDKMDVFFRSLGIAKTLKQAMAEYIIKQVVAVFTTKFAVLISEATTNAIAVATSDRSKGFDEQLFDRELVRTLEAPVRKAFKFILESIPQEVSKYFEGQI